MDRKMMRGTLQANVPTSIVLITLKLLQMTTMKTMTIRTRMMKVKKKRMKDATVEKDEL